MASFSPSPLSFHVQCSYPQKHHLVLCQSSPSEIKRQHQAEGPSLSSASVEVSRKSIGDHMKRRDFLTSSATISASALFLFAPDRLSPAAMALLEADDDEQLLEKVKEDRKKKIKRRGEVNSFKEETASLQIAIYQLSKAGQALDGDDFTNASQVLDETLSKDWIANAEKALSKVSSSSEEQSEAETFSSALASLKTAVKQQDSVLSKAAFAKSAGALEKWSYLTGFAEQLKGL